MKAPAGSSELAGYVTDVPYVYGFKPMLAPAWLDLVAVIGGVACQVAEAV